MKTVSQSMSETYKFHSSILRAYDVRGILGETLSENDAYYLGRAYASFIGTGKRVCVGFDGRLSSPELEEKLVRGLQESGIDVVRVGLGPTPMLYFSVQHLRADGGIMITGSHNPPTHNGFKMMKEKLPLFGEEIQKLGKIASSGEFLNGSGSVSFEDVQSDYISHLKSAASEKIEDLKIAWDMGNGAAGEIVTELVEEIEGGHILINEEIDGTFPAHHPDPSVLENMQQLIDVVLSQGCDVGIAFDGDGDRVGVIDNKGNMIFGDQLMVLLSEAALKKEPGCTIIADVKTSQILFDEIDKNGGKPLMWKTGHSLIKTKMAKEDAYLAGEMSGHIFFKENFGFDDGIYAAIKLLNIISELPDGLANRISQIPKSFSTPEIRVHVDESKKFSIVEQVKTEALKQGAQVNDIDGVRAKLSDGWWLVRASNTEAALVIRCEAHSDDSLVKVRANIEELLFKSGIKL